jgi:hypothetical protein
MNRLTTAKKLMALPGAPEIVVEFVKSPSGTCRSFQGKGGGDAVGTSVRCQDGKPATFATRQEAQRTADVHADDSYANSVPINDGYSWQVDPNVDEWLTERGRTRTSNGVAAAA